MSTYPTNLAKGENALSEIINEYSSDNIAFGTNAGSNVQIGINNTFIGTNTNALYNDISNFTYSGATSVSTTTNPLSGATTSGWTYVLFTNAATATKSFQFNVVNSVTAYMYLIGGGGGGGLSLNFWPKYYNVAGSGGGGSGQFKSYTITTPVSLNGEIYPFTVSQVGTGSYTYFFIFEGYVVVNGSSTIVNGSLIPGGTITANVGAIGDDGQFENPYVSGYGGYGGGEGAPGGSGVPFQTSQYNSYGYPGTVGIDSVGGSGGNTLYAGYTDGVAGQIKVVTFADGTTYNLIGGKGGGFHLETPFNALPVTNYGQGGGGGYGFFGNNVLPLGSESQGSQGGGGCVLVMFNTEEVNSAQNISTLYNYSAAIGYGAAIDASNQIILGTESEYVYIPGKMGVGIKPPTYPLDISGSIRVTGTITGTTGYTGPRGPQGVIGTPGYTGAQGNTGTATNIGPRGITGPRSVTGYTGSTGTQGTQGRTGPTGPQGPQGFTGSTGTQGTRSNTGPQGTQGSQGSQGLTGPTGTFGYTGITGTQGLIASSATGPTGPQGIQGLAWVQSGSNIYYVNGNVGIGVTNPSYTLDVSGTCRFNGDKGNVTLYSTAGRNNIAIGTNTQIITPPVANTNNTSIGNNTQVGTEGGIGISNIAIGTNALNDCRANGAYNVAIGTNALKTNTIGDSNVVVGHYTSSQIDAINNNQNTSVGNDALYNSLTSGSYNTACGNFALSGLTTGNYNTAIGYNAGSTLTTGSNCTIIGYNAQPSSIGVSNEITLGNSSITSLRCNDTSISSLSDARDKKDIVNLDAGLDFISRVRPVRFIWNQRDGGRVGLEDVGFIAQELQQVQEDTNIVIPRLIYNTNPDRLEASYGTLLPVMVKAIQELDDEVDSLIEIMKS